MEKAQDSDLKNFQSDELVLLEPVDMIEVPIVGEIKDFKVTFFDQPTEKVWIPKPQK